MHVCPISACVVPVAQAQLSLLRGGEPLEVTVSLKGARRLIPVHINNRPPSYFIVAGLVFT